MEANVFISKLKADGSENDLTDLDLVFKEYKEILTKLAIKDQGPFSLNVLCILCRNLEKVPSWHLAIDNKALLTLSLECTDRTRTLNAPEQVKLLACIYHIHKHIVKQTISPELTLKLSYIPFETDNLITDYCKTYWNILADRINYMEKLKTKKYDIQKLLPKFLEDILKMIKVYNTVQFCSTVLMFLVKKLHYIYSNIDPKELNDVYVKIFEEIQRKSDLRYFKKLTDKELYDIYVKLNDSLYVIFENSSKINFESSAINLAVQTSILIVGHKPDLLHCLQMLYLNGFCTILSEKEILTYKETILTNFISTCEAVENLGYIKAINLTYPYLNQLLRLFLEYKITNLQKNNHSNFSEQIQMASLKLIEYLMKKLKNCNQILKCEDCYIKTGLHDALRLSFLVKSFITIPLQQNSNITKQLPIYYSIIQQQYAILKDLCTMGCPNYEKCYRKLQSDVHNKAISLNKSQNYDYSIKLFEIYLKNEILHFKSENDLKNISRALYNKSICELDFKMFEDALSDAYLSLVFAYPEGLTTKKYMSLVMDIKAKVLKSKDETHDQVESDIEDIQMTTVLEACAVAIDQKKYGNLKPFFCNLKFSDLLKHEFDMYVKLWPSILPVAGVWKTLHDLTQHDISWLSVTDDTIQEILHTIILQTPSALRTIHNQYLTDIITELIGNFQKNPPKCMEERMFYATILFLKAEYDLIAASSKFRWKVTEPMVDPDQFEALRLISQEHEAIKPAIEAVEMWSDIITDIRTVQISTNLHHMLKIIQIFVPQLLHLYRTLHGLQLAHICCEIADYIGDKTSYVVNASAILYHANKHTDRLSQIIKTASVHCAVLLKNNDSVETALIFLCDCALFYTKTSRLGLAAKLTQAVQAKILDYNEKVPELNLDLALGHLFEAVVELDVEGVSKMTAVIGAHRHYLAVGNTVTKWSPRRLRSLHLKLHISITGIGSTSFARKLLCWRRARSAASATFSAASAVGQAILFTDITNTSSVDDIRVKIDNRLKYILGVQPSSDQVVVPNRETKSDPLFTPRQDLETMLEHMSLRNIQRSPSCLDFVPGFKVAEFLKHDLKCDCYACQNLFSFILACETAGLEASMYFRAKEFDIAKNYFEGCLKSLSLAESKLKVLKKCDKFEKYLVEIVEKICDDHFGKVQVEILIETAFFELAQGNFKMADEHIVTINEIVQGNENTCPYLRNEILNLITTSVKLRNLTNQKTTDSNLESEFENLKLSPPKEVDLAKTPEVKAEKPPKIPKIIVNDEEVPNSKRRVIKLNLDDTDSSDEKESKTKKRISKRSDFKIPVPITAKPVLESITPTPKTRKKPEIKITKSSTEQPSTSIFEFATPKPKNVDKDSTNFFTPIDTPTEQFFTPMSTLKTYSKKTLRKDIVKNLESEFSTPKSEFKKGTTESEYSEVVNKENQKSNSEIPKLKSKKVESGLLKASKDKKCLKRATSPGKLEKSEKIDKKPTRSSRLRQPVKFSLDES